MRSSKRQAAVTYHIETLGEGKTQGARPETHYNSFKRTLISDSDQLQPEQVFTIGDVVYLPSSYEAPMVGVLTHLWTLDERVQTEKDTIYGVVRLLHWPEWMSTMAKKRMDRLTSKHEIYYTHKATKVSRRKTKTATRSGQQGDDFEHGPALHDYSFEVQEIIAKVHIHPSKDGCLETIRQASALVPPSTNQCQPRVHCVYKNKSFPTHLFCERAVDPNRELFWKINWEKVVKRGVQDRRWDLLDESGEPLDDLSIEAKSVNNVAQEMAQAKRIIIEDQTSRPNKAPLCASPTKKSTSEAMSTTQKQARTRPQDSQTPKGTSKKVRKTFDIAESDFSISDQDSDDSFQSQDELNLEDDLLVKAYEDDTAVTSDSDSTFSSDSDDSFRATRSKRKRGKPRKNVPDTPSKRRVLATPRKSLNLLNSPTRATATPRSRARLLGLKVRNLPHPSLPARPPKISSLSVQEINILSPQEQAKRLLHVGATPDHLPCREGQYEEIMACVQDAVEEGIGGCVYVSGVPGTGKTATVRQVIRCLTIRAEQNEMNPFSFVEINGMKMVDASQAYSLLWSAISSGQKTSPKTALSLLSSHFARVGAINSGGAGGAGVGAGPGRAATVVLMDELDQLVTARQDVMYNMFNWPNTRGSRLIVIAVANTMDLPERTLNPKVASRLGMTRITFMPYNDRQLVEIVRSRLGMTDGEGNDAQAIEEDKAATRGCNQVFSLDAITYVSKRVSNVSGDARRMLDVCRRAIELVEMKAVTEQEVTASKPKQVTIMDMKQVLDSMVKSGKMSHILSLPLHGKILLLSLLSCLRRSGLVEANLADIYGHHKAICRMYSIVPPSSSLASLVADSQEGTYASATSTMSWEGIDLSTPLATLCSLGLIICVGQGAGTGRAGHHARVMMACQEDEVRLAFEHDQDERLRKML